MKKMMFHHWHGSRPLKLILTLMLGVSLAGATLSGCSDTDSSPKTSHHDQPRIGQLGLQRHANHRRERRQAHL